MLRSRSDCRRTVPLKKHYDLVNFTFEGVSDSLPSGEADFDLPGIRMMTPIRVGKIPWTLVSRAG